ncbi:hypothetical protein ACFPM0_36665 [Pseudonocardia sulfidoxydans]
MASATAIAGQARSRTATPASPASARQHREHAIPLQTLSPGLRTRS